MLAGSAMFLAGFLCAAIVFRKVLFPQYEHLRECIGGIAQGEKDVTAAVVSFSLFAIFLLFVLEVRQTNRWILCLVSNLLLLSAPFLGLRPGVPSVLLLGCFQLVFWGVHMPKKQTREEDEKQRVKGEIRSLLWKGMAAVLLISMIFTQFGSEWMYDAAYKAEGSIQKAVKRISGTADRPSDGTINRGNLYPAGTKQLDLWVSHRPNETISAMYYFMNLVMQWERSEDNSRYLSIHYMGDPFSEWYVPYFSMPYHQDWDEMKKGFTFTYMEQADIETDWDQITQFQQYKIYYEQLQDEYAAIAKETYTEVPEKQIPRLAEFCSSHPKEGVEEITAFILDTLNESASYTRTPGMSPFNRDPVEYFLFDSREGYCQHFASAAVLMFRMYGIPARYAAGYAVSPSDFTENEDGWHAEVTDEAAHAWPEIFVENVGWIPVEATPSARGEMTVYPGMDEEILRAELNEERGTKTEEVQKTDTDTGQEVKEEKRETNQQLFAVDEKVFLHIALLLMAAAAAGMAIYQRKKRKRMHGQRCIL